MSDKDMRFHDILQAVRAIERAYREKYPDGKMSMEDFLRPKKEIKDLISSKTGETPGEGG